jgi:hypothetical protein
MPRARADINWDAVKVMWLNGQHTSEELGATFGISADGIRGRAFRERWKDLKRIKRDKTTVSQALPEVRVPASSEEIIERAEKLRGPASFRRRVAEQAERIIDKLEVKEPDSIRELDSFAEVLVKTEKVGARAYGIDSEGPRPVINIEMLTGPEHPYVMDLPESLAEEGIKPALKVLGVTGGQSSSTKNGKTF